MALHSMLTASGYASPETALGTLKALLSSTAQPPPSALRTAREFVASLGTLQRVGSLQSISRRRNS
jgi:hypothetical protein